MDTGSQFESVCVWTGKLSKKKFEGYMNMIKPTLNYNDLSQVDIVIEAVKNSQHIHKYSAM